MSEQIEEEEEVKEFRDYITKYRPREVNVIWEGVFVYQTWHDPHFPDYLVNHYYYTVTARANGKAWQVERPCGTVAADTSAPFSPVLYTYGYQLKERYGATGHWTYVFQRPVIHKTTTKPRKPRPAKPIAPDEGLGPVEKQYLTYLLTNGENGSMKEWKLFSSLHWSLSYTGIGKRVKALEKRGLIKTTRTPPRNGVLLTLTPLGVEVAKRLEEQ
ncbi:MAG: hypothetical protein C0179_04290 [Fervidicoccus sp.]|nr:MAG: hypothetical protein C0179_04290 [Fervidicoccus sp.]